MGEGRRSSPRFYVIEEVFEHTSSVVEAERYFESLDSGVDLPDDQEEDEWHPVFEAHTARSVVFHLPRLRCERCGREVWRFNGGLSFDIPSDWGLRQFVYLTGKSIYLSVEEWRTFFQTLSEEMRKVGRQVPLFGPGYRVGTEHLKIRYQRPKGFFQIEPIGGSYISEDTASVLKQVGANGYELYPAPVDQAKPVLKHAAVPPLPHYHELSVVGRARLDTAKSDYVPPTECELCQGFIDLYGEVRWRSLVPDVNAWDGSDVFRLEEAPGYILVTERLKQSLETSKLTGFRLVPADTISNPPIPDIRKLSDEDIWRAFRDE